MCGILPERHCPFKSDAISAHARSSSNVTQPKAVKQESQFHWKGYKTLVGTVYASSSLLSRRSCCACLRVLLVLLDSRDFKKDIIPPILQDSHISYSKGRYKLCCPAIHSRHLFQVLIEELYRSGPCQFSIFRVITASGVIVETMIGVFVDISLIICTVFL